jgi:hypothetical protein
LTLVAGVGLAFQSFSRIWCLSGARHWHMQGYKWWQDPKLQRALGVGAPALPGLRPDVVWSWGNLGSASAIDYANDPRRRGYHGW